MCKELNKIIKGIRKHIHTKEGLEEVEQAFIKYGEYCHDKTLRNNRKIVNYYVNGMREEFMRLKTHGEERDERRNHKKSNVKTGMQTLLKNKGVTREIQ